MSFLITMTYVGQWVGRFRGIPNHIGIIHFPHASYKGSHAEYSTPINEAHILAHGDYLIPSQ